MKVYQSILASVFIVTLTVSAADAKFGKFKVPGATVDLTKPDEPVKPDPVQIGPVTVTPPSPVLTPGAPPPTPEVRLDPSVPGASTFNKMNEWARLPETKFKEGANWVAAGVDHAANEIGMLLAKAKDKAEKAAKDWIDGWLAWLKEMAMKYGPKVGTALLVLIAIKIAFRRQRSAGRPHRHSDARLA